MDEISGTMTSRYIGSLRKFFGNPLSSSLDAINTLSLIIVIIGGLSNAVWTWHKEGLCLNVLRGLFTPLYNYIIFPIKVALMAIDNYHWDDDDDNEGEDELPEITNEVISEEAKLKVDGEGEGQG